MPAHVAPRPPPADRPVPVVLDCDPGNDDAFTLLWAVAEPAVDLLAVTTVAGNQDVVTCTRNARRILALAGAQDVPVLQGAGRPLVRDAPSRSAVHGADGLGGFPDALSQPVPGNRPRHATACLTHLLQRRTAPVTVVATGPLTNLACLAATRPDLLDRLTQIVWMGGNRGSQPAGVAAQVPETNAAADPESLAAVLAAAVPFTMCGLDVTSAAVVTPQVVDAFDQLGTSTGAACAAALRFVRRSYREVRGTTQPPLHDPVALARVLDPELVRCEPASVTVDTAGGPTAGTTVVRTGHAAAAGRRHQVATGLDVERFWRGLIGSIARLR